MVTGCNKNIKVWKFEKGKMDELKKLEGHTYNVFCLVFSKKTNWFASGSGDNEIRCWKELDNGDWESAESQKKPSGSIYQLILNNNESQLISCSDDSTIIVWQVNTNTNQINFDYILEKKHKGCVYSISMNDPETQLVSSSYDKQIILWGKGKNKQWEYQNRMERYDFGCRICFIEDDEIIWQQWHQGVAHILKVQNGQLKEQPEFRIQLKANKDTCFFPTIFNQKKQVIIQKHDKYIYIIRKQIDGNFQIEAEPIDCGSHSNFGALTSDGEYLVVWSDDTKDFRVYKISYG